MLVIHCNSFLAIILLLGSYCLGSGYARWEDELSNSFERASASPLGLANLGLASAKFYWNGLLKWCEMSFAESNSELRDIRRRLSKISYRQLQDEMGIGNSYKFVVSASDSVTMDKLQLLSCHECAMQSGKPHSLLMSNHIFQWDFIPILKMMDRFGAIDRPSFVLSERLKNMPFYGWAMAQNNYIFVGKDWERDEAQLHEGAMKFKRGRPGILSIFPEGTLRSPKKIKISQDFSRKHGIRGFEHAEHVLVPRARGLYTLLKKLDPTVDGIFDITISASGFCPCYDPTVKYSIVDLVVSDHGRRPKEIQVGIKFIPIREISLDSYEKFKEFLFDRFRVKNEMLQRYERTGNLFENYFSV